ncbi:MAG: DMT family transporter [Angustibacter sp.]
MTAPSAGLRRRPGELLATGCLLGITLVWGSTFVLIKDAVQSIPVADFLATRFAVAAVAAMLISWPRLRWMSARDYGRGVLLGLFYGAGQLSQTWGLDRSTASITGFITGLYVIITPFLTWVILRERVPRVTWISAGLSLTGVGVLAISDWRLGPGTGLVAISAVFYAAHVLGLGAWSRAGQALALTSIQLATVATLCLICALPGGLSLPADRGSWIAIAYTALLAGLLAVLGQTWAQARLSPTRAAVILTGEPLFAAIVAVVFGEDLSSRLLLGGGLILLAMFLMEVRPAGRATPDRTSAPPARDRRSRDTPAAPKIPAPES